ncbi:MAG TPA: NADH-ubiquinone oxidoreductase-F iron-sulfur binding region domain-containing protein [Dehalococcoidia bacterium]|nr:NADH-ubiquinone oxidoreductase-F iron-sulfur binding region domain-containing protein [Dehalococcoidia bacterium]
MATYQEIRADAEKAWAPFAKPARTLIRVQDATCSRSSGAAGTLAAIREALRAGSVDADVMVTGCMGLCYAEPIVEVVSTGGTSVYYQHVTADRLPALMEAIRQNRIASGLALAVGGESGRGDIPPLASLPFWRGQVRRLMENCGVTDPENIDHYIARGGYEGLHKAVRVGGEAVIKEVMESGLWGRGGAAFPTARKWEFLRGSDRHPKYMICNADEGDPGSFVNRNLLESDPHSTVEGIIIGGLASDADKGYIYIRDEYPLPVARVRKAVEQAREKGFLGENILGSGFNFEIEVIRGAGSYVCGEETGLIASLEDRRGMPKIKPPFPAQAGVFAQPSNVNNVESYASAPMIMRHGADWYAAMGTEKNRGTKMFSLSGQIQRVGILEVPMGTPMSDLILGAGGGPPEGRSIKAIQPGGPLSGIVPGRDIDIPLEPEPFKDRGMFMGSGGLVVLDDTNCIVDLCVYFEWFAEDESCGRCTTCFAGTRRLLEILRRIASGRGRKADLELIRLLGETMRNSNCVHGQAAPTSVMSMFRFFEDELLEHVERKRCPAKKCAGLIRYEVLHQSDRLPLAEAICPTGAVVNDGGSYRIDQEKCVKCDACREQAPYAIALVDEFVS